MPVTVQPLTAGEALPIDIEAAATGGDVAPDFATTNVGDRTDTSPYLADQPVIGISTGTFIQKMATLIGYLEGSGPS